MDKILENKQIQQKMVRIAHQILENTTEERTVYIAGICGNGFQLAKELTELLQANSKQEFVVFEIVIDKENPLTKTISCSIDLESLKKAYFILVDDVVNSGKTMQYALIKLLEHPTKAIKTVALVDRKHRRYPVKCDFVGLTLSTTLQERVEVTIEKDEISAYLV